MKKLLFILIIASIAPALLKGQYAGITVNSQTVTKNLKAIATDNSGNTILTGSYRTTLTIGSSTLVNNNPDAYFEGNAAFIAKMNSVGNYSWVAAPVVNKIVKKSCTYNGSVTINGVSTDATGYVYITGSVYGSVSFGSTTVVTTQKQGGGTCPDYNSSMFTAKLSSTGNFLWVKLEGVLSNKYGGGQSITTDASGNVYATGQTVQKESSSINCGGIPGVQLYAYVVKYNSSGTKVWEKKYANNLAVCDLSLSGSSIVSDGSNVYVSGRYIGSINFGNNYSFNSSVNSMFLLKLDGNGITLWAQSASTNLYDITIKGLLSSDNQSIYISGRFDGSVTFGTINLVSSSSNDQYLASYNTNSGSCSWAVNAGPGFAKGSFLHPNGTIGMGGMGSAYTYTIKEYSTAGTLMNTTTSNSTNVITGALKDITSTIDGFIYSDNLQGSYDIAGNIISSASTGNKDMMLVKYTYTPLSLKRNESGNKANNKLDIDNLMVEIKNNPAYDQFIFTISSNNVQIPIDVRIMNLEGKILEATTLNAFENVISLGEKLQSGIYYAVITQGQNRITEKLLKLK